MKRITFFVHGAGLLLGGFLGWLYYAKIGCVSGTCAIWASPWLSTGYGAAMGTLIFGLLPVTKDKSE